MSTSPAFQRILFLDLDGPMHPQGTVSFIDEATVHFGNAFCWWPILEALLKQTCDVGIVIHSTWRCRWTAEELYDIIPLGMRPYYMGVADPSYMGRDQAIVHTWPVFSAKGFVDYRILDDEPNALPSFPEHVIACSSHSGLSSPSVQAALQAWLLGV